MTATNADQCVKDTVLFPESADAVLVVMLHFKNRRHICLVSISSLIPWCALRRFAHCFIELHSELLFSSFLCVSDSQWHRGKNN